MSKKDKDKEIDFISDYRALCRKHELELEAVNNQLNVIDLENVAQPIFFNFNQEF